MATIEVQRLEKTYGNGNEAVKAVRAISFEIPSGDFFTLLGPSGCGKTTTMRCIAGLERPERGRIAIDGQEMLDAERGIFIPTARRPIGMVFQSYAIWPHMTVFDNVAYPLRVLRMSRQEIRTAVGEALELVGLTGETDRPAPKLSGGQQQRVALARALVGRPKVLILDEPLSNLDAALRHQMRGELKKLQAQLGITTVYVTHDQNEALSMSDDLAVMRSGEIVQIGSPYQVYHHPTSRFAAEFIGTTNLLSVDGIEHRSGEASFAVHTCLGTLRASGEPGIEDNGEPLMVSVRPESIHLAKSRDLAVDGIVLEAMFLGSLTEYVVDVAGQRLKVQRPSTERQWAADTRVRVHVEDIGVTLLVDRRRKLPTPSDANPVLKPSTAEVRRGQ